MKIKILLIAPLTEYHGQGKVSLIARDILKKNYNIFEINTYNNSNIFYNILYNLFVLYKIFFNIRKYTHIYFTPSRNFLSSIKDFATLFLKPKSSTLISHVHGSELNKFLNQKGFYFKALRRLYLNKLDRCIILSNSHKFYALGNDFDRYFVINNPSKAKFTNKIIKSSELAFCTISNPIKDKGLDTVINKLNSYKLKSKLTLDVIGWTLNDYIKNYGHKPKLSNGIINFLGFVDGSKKFQILKKSNFFIFLTRYETEAQPLTVIEALISQCAVIINDFKMMKDYFVFKNVYNVEAINSFDDLKKIMDNQSAYYSIDLDELQKYTIDNFEKSILNVIT